MSVREKVTRIDGVRSALAGADRLVKTNFEATIDRSIETVIKTDDDEFLIWGPASVEVVDKEQDRVSVQALESALPQLLKRARLSYQHTDQIVGRILKEFTTEGEVEVQVDGTAYKRDTFPTDVLNLDNDEPPALFVAGEVYADSEQSKKVRKEILNNTVNSYSISGEALMTEKQVQDGQVFDDIIEMDLSAITLCEEGMNQKAKFTRVSGDSVAVDEVVPADTDLEKDAHGRTDTPSFAVREGGVVSPANAKTVVAKSMSETSENTDVTSIDGEIATKSFVAEKEDEIVGKAEQRAVNVVEQSLPKGGVPSIDAVESLVKNEVARRMKEMAEGEHDGDHEEMEEEEEEREMEDDDYEDDTMGEDYEDETMGGDYEDETMGEDYEDETMGGDYEDEMEGEHGGEVARAEGDGTTEGFTRAELEAELPADVWDVVSEYVGDEKAKSDSQTIEQQVAGLLRGEETNETVEPANPAQEQVASLLTGAEDVEPPGIGVNERSDEIDKMTSDEDTESELDATQEDEIVADESPALSNFNY